MFGYNVQLRFVQEALGLYMLAEFESEKLSQQRSFLYIVCLVQRLQVNKRQALIILEHVNRAGLAKICPLNKIFCSCSQDVLYRNIKLWNNRDLLACLTLTQPPHLARRVRSFKSFFCDPELA
jgi:hypothetical protein